MTRPHPRASESTSLIQAREHYEDEVASAERSFAVRAAYDGIRAAFLSVLAEDSLILGDGLEPGRPAYEALPSDFRGRLMWEPAAVAASADGTLAFTTGPYRLLDRTGQEKGAGVYFSVWRRHATSGHLELLLDVGAKGAVFPDQGDEPRRLSVGPIPEEALPLEDYLHTCLQEGRWPRSTGTLLLGETDTGLASPPSGLHLSQDGELGVLWGGRLRPDGQSGATTAVVRAGFPEPSTLAWINA
jgi:hypothetical protein